MTEPLERDRVIELLQRLGSDQDEEVLEAARQVHARIAAAGVAWEDLLLPDAADDDGGAGEAEPEDAQDEAPEPPAEAAPGDADSLALIDALLARSGLSEDLRQELKDYKADIAEGEFTDADRRYLRAVHARLTKRR